MWEKKNKKKEFRDQERAYGPRKGTRRFKPTTLDDHEVSEVAGSLISQRHYFQAVLRLNCMWSSHWERGLGPVHHNLLPTRASAIHFPSQVSPAVMGRLSKGPLRPSWNLQAHFVSLPNPILMPPLRSQICVNEPGGDICKTSLYKRINSIPVG